MNSAAALAAEVFSECSPSRCRSQGVHVLFFRVVFDDHLEELTLSVSKELVYCYNNTFLLAASFIALVDSVLHRIF